MIEPWSSSTGPYTKESQEPTLACDAIFDRDNIDLQNALELATSPQALTVSPLSQSELDIREDRFKLFIGNQDILSYTPPRVGGTIEEVRNLMN